MSAYSEPVIKTPVFVRVARDRVLFTRAYCASPAWTAWPYYGNNRWKILPEQAKDGDES